MKINGLLTAGIVVFAFIFVQGTVGQTATGPLRPEGVMLSKAGVPQPAKVMLGRKDMPPFRIAPPANFAAQPATATFTIQYLNAGEANYYGDVSVGWPEAAKAAFTYAANIWGTLLNSSVPITISACWANLGTGGVLGYGGARDYFRDFTGAPQANTFYPIATANAIYGSDLNGGTVEIDIAYNAQFTDWHFGPGPSPSDKIDLIMVAMHEIGHGIGFIGSMNVESGLGYWGLSGYPAIYDRYTEDGAGTKLITYTSGTAALANQLISGSVYFNGANANAGNGGSKVKLYAPGTWSGGSSYAHLDEIFNGTANAMMTWSADYGETIHDPGPVTMGILNDNGWTVATQSPVGPTIKANGATGTVTVNYPETVSITVAMNAGNYAGENVDWWVVAYANGAWWYLGSQWTEFDGNPAYCQPAYRGPLFNLSSTPVLNGFQPLHGTYHFWFAVTHPMSGILDPSGHILFDNVTVIVQ